MNTTSIQNIVPWEQVQGRAEMTSVEVRLTLLPLVNDVYGILAIVTNIPHKTNWVWNDWNWKNLIQLVDLQNV